MEYQEFEEMLLDIVSSVYSFLEEKHVKGRRNLIRGEKKKNGIWGKNRYMLPRVREEVQIEKHTHPDPFHYPYGRVHT